MHFLNEHREPVIELHRTKRELCREGAGRGEHPSIIQVGLSPQLSVNDQNLQKYSANLTISSWPPDCVLSGCDVLVRLIVSGLRGVEQRANREFVQAVEEVTDVQADDSGGRDSTRAGREHAGAGECNSGVAFGREGLGPARRYGGRGGYGPGQWTGTSDRHQ